MADLQGDDNYNEDDDGYTHDVITTMDPGPSLLIATFVFCVAMYVLLPFMVKLCNRREFKNKQREEELQANNGGAAAKNNQNKNEMEDDDDDDDQSSIPLDSFRTAKNGLDAAEEEISLSQASVANSLVSFIGPVLDNIGPVLDTVKPGPGRKERYRKRTRAAMERRDAELDQTEGQVVYVESQEFASEVNSAASQSLSLYDPDEVSFHDAVDGLSCHPPVTDIYMQKHVGFCRSTGIYFGKLLSIAEWDYETRRIYKLGFPFFLQALLEGVNEFGRVSIIGRLIGTKELAAYVTVDMLIMFTAEVLGGFHESLVSLLSHSIGTGNRKLTGQYVQLSIELYVIFSIPFMILWFFVIEDTLLLFGFDNETAQIGKRFAVPYMFYALLEGVLESIHGLFDVTDLEMASTIMTVIGEVTATLAVFIAAWFWKPALETVGFIYLILAVVELVVTIVVIFLKGWFRKYYCGLFGSFALTNRPAVVTMMKTSSYLSAGYLLAYGEWEILAFFAKFLGPAEVAAWNILGTLWEALEEITEAIADAAEVRVAHLLGAGQPKQARKSAYKAVFIAFVFALVSTSCLFIAGDNLSTWLTTDPTLQLLINELIPLFGLGNIVLTMGTMAWTIVGAQGRYRLSTAIACAGSWLITMPLAAVFSIGLRINLQGQTAAVVIGYMVSGMVTNIVLFRSDWNMLSRKVIEVNKEDGCDSDDDDSSSSSSSSPSEVCNKSSLDIARDIINSKDPAPPQEEEQSKAEGLQPDPPTGLT